MVNGNFVIDLTRDIIDDGADFVGNHDKYYSYYRSYIDGIAAEVS